MLRAFVMNWEIEGKLTLWRTTQVSVSFPEWLYGTRTCIHLTDYGIVDFHSFMVTRNLREQMTADAVPQGETSTTEDDINLHTQPLSGFALITNRRLPFCARKREIER